MRFENLLLEEIMQELNQSVVKFNNINSIYLNNNIERHHDDNVIGNIHDDTYNYTSGSKDINKSLWDIKKGSDSSNRLLNNINNINTNLNDCSPLKMI